MVERVPRRRLRGASECYLLCCNGHARLGLGALTLPGDSGMQHLERLLCHFPRAKSTQEVHGRLP
jgi:hypothetical protein